MLQRRFLLSSQSMSGQWVQLQYHSHPLQKKILLPEFGRKPKAQCSHPSRTIIRHSSIKSASKRPNRRSRQFPFEPDKHNVQQ